MKNRSLAAVLDPIPSRRRKPIRLSHAVAAGVAVVGDRRRGARAHLRKQAAVGTVRSLNWQPQGPRVSVSDPNGAAPALTRRRLQPLASLWPYIWRHPGMVLAALAALVASAAAMLTVPVAVRRMIDHGFSGADGIFIDQYFAMLIAIGLVLAVASAGRMYAVNWLGERVVADLRADVFRHLATLGPAFYETTHSGEVMSRLTADTTQIKSAAGSALSQALRNTIMLLGALVMMFVTSATLSSLALAGDPGDRLPAAGLRPRRAAPLARRPGPPGGRLRLCRRQSGRGAGHGRLRPGGGRLQAVRGGRRARLRCGARRGCSPAPGSPRLPSSWWWRASSACCGSARGW